MGVSKKEFIQKLYTLSEILGDKITSERAEIYWDIFKDYSKEQLDKALNIIIKTSKFFPKPAEIIELIEGSLESKSTVAWEQVRKAIFEHGAYQSIIFADKVIHKVIDLMGGWQKICSTLEDDMKWVEKDFTRFYRAYQNQPLKDYPQVLIGIQEEHNRNLGNGTTFIQNGQIRQVKDVLLEPIRIGFKEEKSIEDKTQKKIENKPRRV